MLRRMSACITDRDAEGQEADQEAGSGRHGQPGATAACLPQENRVSAVGSVPANTCSVFGKREWVAHTHTAVGLSFRARPSARVIL